MCRCNSTGTDGTSSLVLWLKKLAIDTLGDHVNTCTGHSGTKKAHNWSVDQIADLFRTTHKVKTQQVVRDRGQRCGDIDLTSYLVTTADPVPLVLDLLIVHDRWVSSSDPSINAPLHYPNDVDMSLNEVTTDKIRKYHTDYNNYPPPVSPLCRILLVHRGGYTVNL